MQKRGDVGYCPICGEEVPLERHSSTRLDVAAARCSERCAIALDVLVALRELERRDSDGIAHRVDAYFAGEPPRAALSDLLLARWRQGMWTPEPAAVLAAVDVVPDFAAFTRPRRDETPALARLAA